MAPRAIFQHSLSAHAYICFLFIYFSIFQNNININININIHTYTYLLETLARQYICICLEKPADACRTSAEFTQAITASFPGIFIENCVVGLIWFSTYLVQHREHPYLASCSRLTGQRRLHNPVPMKRSLMIIGYWRGGWLEKANQIWKIEAQPGDARISPMEPECADKHVCNTMLSLYLYLTGPNRDPVGPRTS